MQRVLPPPPREKSSILPLRHNSTSTQAATSSPGTFSICTHLQADESQKQQFTATAHIISFITLILKDAAWAERRAMVALSHFLFAANVSSQARSSQARSSDSRIGPGTSVDRECGRAVSSFTLSAILYPLSGRD